MSSAPSLKLTYFDFRGRAENVRIILAIGGIEFEDERISFEEFASRKAAGEFPYGSLPVLYVDGKPHAQSGALIRYVGSLTSLYPSDPSKALRVDEILFLSEDITRMLPSLEPDEETIRKFVDEGAPRYFGGVDKLIQETMGPFLLGEQMTVADISLYTFWKVIQLGVIKNLPKNVMDPYENLMGAVRSVAKHEKVVEWERAHEKNEQ